ncbi:MAG: hypothetical protein JST89_12375 [Cyanobacteria bacterium SZAS-4]|nr:hypothetical protein [Cyanobacteria bacterium SZAS-4]
MIIREKDPDVLVTSPQSDSTAAYAIIALVFLSIIGFAIYYFSSTSSVTTTTVQPAPAAPSMTVINQAPPASVPEVPMAPQPAPATQVVVPVPVPVAAPAPAPAAPAVPEASSSTTTETQTTSAPQ